MEGDRQHAGPSLQMNHPGKIRAGDTTRIPDGYPVFCEGNVLPRLQERISLLISEEARLQLDIGAVVVGKCLAPIKAIRVNSPGSNFPGFHGRTMIPVRRSGYV